MRPASARLPAQSPATPAVAPAEPPADPGRSALPGPRGAWLLVPPGPRAGQRHRSLQPLAAAAAGGGIGGGAMAAASPGSPVALALLGIAVVAAMGAAVLAVRGAPLPRRGVPEAPSGSLQAALGFLGSTAVIGSAVVSGFAAAAWAGVFDFRDFAHATMPSVAGLAGLCLALAAASLGAMTRGPPHAVGVLPRAGTMAAAAVAGAGLLLAALAASERLGHAGGVPVTARHAVLGLNLAAGAVLAAVLLAARAPTVFRAPAQGGAWKAVAYPAVAGIAVVAGVLGLLASSGAEGASDNARVVPLLLFLVVGFMFAATLGAVLQERHTRPPPLYVQRMAPERRRKLALAFGGMALAVVVAVPGLAILGGHVQGVPAQRGLELALLAPLVGMAPVAMYDHWYDRRRTRLEDRLPDLLRDLAASRRAGLTLPKAVAVASKGNYDALGPEVQRMADEVSWGESFESSLDRMSERVGTLGVRSVAAVVREASASGGEVHDVLQVVSDQGREARELAAERRRSMSLYVTVMYVAFFVFLAILVLLDATFLPAMADSGASVTAAAQAGQGNPLGLGAIDLAEYRRFFLVAAYVQGVGDGVVAGVMSTGRLGSGLKHAVIMGAIAVGMFLMLPVPPPL